MGMGQALCPAVLSLILPKPSITRSGQLQIKCVWVGFSDLLEKGHRRFKDQIPGRIHGWEGGWALVEWNRRDELSLKADLEQPCRERPQPSYRTRVP